jgi:hypothetical protein
MISGRRVVDRRSHTRRTRHTQIFFKAMERFFFIGAKEGVILMNISSLPT